MSADTLRAALDGFMLDCDARGLAVKTVEFYRWQLERAVTWLEGQGVRTLGDVTAFHLRGYQVELQKRGLSASSVHAGARSLRAWLYWCEREDLLPGKNPARRVRMPKRPKKQLPAVSRADVSKLLAATEGSVDPLRDKAIILVLVDTGVRASELCGLTVGDLDGNRLMVRNGKGGKDRPTFIGECTKRAVGDYLATRSGAAPSEPLFASLDGGGALSYDGLKQLIERLGLRAGVQVHAHALRRTFAVESLRAGCDLVRLARMMGHADLVMLQSCYLPLLEDDLADAHRRTSPVDNLPAAGRVPA